MKDDELIEQMKALVIPRIRERMSRIHKEMLDSAEFAQMYVNSGMEVPKPVALPLDEESWADVQSILNNSGSLTTVATDLLWAAVSMADDGFFVVNDSSVAAAVNLVNIKDLAVEAGMQQDDAFFVLCQMAESFKEVVCAHTSIIVLVNRKPVEFRAE